MVPLRSTLPSDQAFFAATIARRLQFIYRHEFREGIVNRILHLASHRYATFTGWNEQEVVLITYGNSLVNPGEKPLQTLYRFLSKNLTGVVSCVHILPFFPFTSDDGFSVADYRAVNPELGDWSDILKIGSDFALMADLVINHVSVSHPWFRNYLVDRDPGKNYFIESEPLADYSQVIRPRSSPLFTPFETPSGVRKVWTTFSADQADLNFANPEVLIDMIKVMLFYLGKGIRIIRLDAIAFLWKEGGTTCLHLPETHQVVKLLRDIISRVSPGAILLTETNVPNRENWSYFGTGDEAHMVYQFSLPPLLLHALFSGNSRYLSRWTAEIPALDSDQTFLNYTASHDGIGVRPLEGLLPQEEIGELISGMKTFGGLVSSRLNPDGSQSPYEINIAWMDAMKGDRNGEDALQEDRFICSQTIMMALQGIPAFYIHSLLGTSNDLEGLRDTGRARSINRKQWVEKELQDRLRGNTLHGHVFQELCRLIRIRRGCDAFHPGSKQQVLVIDDRIFALKRHNPQTGITLYSISNITGQPVGVPVCWETDKNYLDLISDEWSEASGTIRLKAYQTCWFV